MTTILRAAALLIFALAAQAQTLTISIETPTLS